MNALDLPGKIFEAMSRSKNNINHLIQYEDN